MYVKTIPGDTCVYFEIGPARSAIIKEYLEVPGPFTSHAEDGSHRRSYLAALSLRISLPFLLPPYLSRQLSLPSLVPSPVIPLPRPSRTPVSFDHALFQPADSSRPRISRRTHRDDSTIVHTSWGPPCPLTRGSVAPGSSSWRIVPSRSESE